MDTQKQDPASGRVAKVLVLGGGSAGFIAAISLKVTLPHLRVVVVRSKEIGVIGVGEATTVAVPLYLHGNLRIDPAAFYRVAQPVWKLGIRFLWGPRPFFDYTFSHQIDSRWSGLPRTNGYYCDEVMEDVDVASSLMSADRAFARTDAGDPVFGHNVGYHIENVNFVEFLEGHAASVGVEIVDDTVVGVTPAAPAGDGGEPGVAAVALASGRTEAADLFVDCSGFASLLLGKALAEPFVSYRPSLFCSRAIVGNWERGAGEVVRPYTTAETMAAGWCWQIDHEHHVNRGYVYSPDFVSDAEAEAELRAKNPRIGAVRLVRFVSGRYERAWVGNVVAIGNSAGFVEPLESTGLSAICDASQGLAESLVDADGRPGPATRRIHNMRSARNWDAVRRFLAIHYKYNTRLDTPFWRACRADVDASGTADLVAYYQENGPSTLHRSTLLDPRDQFGMEGYLVMLVGQRVPYRRTHVPTAREWAIWERTRAASRALAARGLTVPEALGVIRAPTWRWNPEFYSPSAPRPMVSTAYPR